MFNVAANVKLVPLFQDKDLEAYFSTFEHTAMTLEWPQDKWTILLSTALKGKAQVAYANVEPVDKYNYTFIGGRQQTRRVWTFIHVHRLYLV